MGGSSDSKDFQGPNVRAYLYSNGTMTDLNDFVQPGCGWTLRGAFAINDNGQIVGVGYNPSGYEHAFLLTPPTVPEPSTLLIWSGLGAMGLIATWRRRKRAS